MGEPVRFCEFCRAELDQSRGDDWELCRRCAAEAYREFLTQCERREMLKTPE